MSNQSVNVRQAFCARPGYYYIDVDYSQIEFRLSAAMAGERPLITGFMEGADYYRMIYKQMAGGSVALDAITKTQRQLGKTVALGQNYGQEEYGLAFKLKCSVEKAKEIMDSYWSGLSATARARELALQRALKEGGVRTWFGRWRPLPDLFSNVPKVRKKGIRSVWNTIIQGTAADWLKIAMVRSGRALRGRDAHMLLTVHDELLYEVNEKEPLLEITEIIKQAMEFKVKGLPIGNTDLYPDGYWVPVDVEYGYNWGELYHLEDTKNKDGSVKQIGFRTFCEQNGKSINWSEPPPVIQVSFVAEPNREPMPVIPERHKNVANAKPDHKTSTPGGIHPLDHLMNIIRTRTGETVVVSDQINTVLTEAEVTETEEVVLASPSAVEPPKVEINHTNGTVMKENTGDFVYPCVIVKVPLDLNEKQITFLKALFTKYPGKYGVYLEYREKTVRAGANFSVDPNSDFITFVKKCLGDRAAIEIYDDQGRVARSRVNFV